MDVFQFRERLIGDYAAFTRSFTMPRAEDTQAYLEERYAAGEFWPAPLVQLNPSFVSSGTVEDLVAAGRLHPECARLFRIGKTATDWGFSLRLHQHQDDAIRIDPKLDQHAAHEFNRLGKPICPRLGAAVDFLVQDENMLEVAQWVAANTSFDRLYFYGNDRPIHVSYGPEHKRQVVAMVSGKDGRLIPRVLRLNSFKNK